MLPKKFPVKPKAFHFSSEDSQETDRSMNSSLDIAESMELNNAANKFNQLRETMNKYFQVNPELAAAIRFEQFEAPEPDEPVVAKQKDYYAEAPVTPVNKRSESKKSTMLTKKGNNSTIKLQVPEETQISKGSTRMWSAIGREMNRTLKGTSVPTIGQINHAMNLFKRDFEKPGVLEHALNSPKSLTSPKRFTFDRTPADFRIQSAKAGNASTRNKGGKDSKNKNDQSQDEESEDGVSYFSFRRRMHLQTKAKRKQEAEQSRLLKMKEEEEKEKRSKEKDAKIINTLADLDEELNLGGRRVGKENTEKSHGTIIRNNAARTNRRASTTKVGSTIFDRLAGREGTIKTDSAESPSQRKLEQGAKTFSSQFAETLYSDMKTMGYSDGFRKSANIKIGNFKREFQEKVAKQRHLTSEGLKFHKEGSKQFNLYLPDFERTAHVSNKDAVFVINEPPKHSEEWREHKENEVLYKFQKLATGTLMDLWRDAKDLNQ